MTIIDPLDVVRIFRRLRPAIKLHLPFVLTLHARIFAAHPLNEWQFPAPQLLPQMGDRHAATVNFGHFIEVIFARPLGYVVRPRE